MSVNLDSNKILDGIDVKANQLSISPTFYEQLFSIKVFCAAFMYLQFVFVFFGKRKSARLRLVKLTLDLIHKYIKPGSS